MKKITTIIILLSVIGLSALSLEEAKQIALEHNPDLLAAEQSAKASKSSLWNSYLAIVPTATVSGSYTYYDETQNNFGSDYDASSNYSLVVNQPIFYGGKVFMEASISRDAYKISQNSYHNTYLQTIVDLKSKYFAALQNKELLKIAEQSLLTSRVNVEIAETKYQAGSIAKADLLQLQSEQASNEVNLLQMEMVYENSILELANFLQLNEITDLQEVARNDHKQELALLKDKTMSDLDNIMNQILQMGMEKNPVLNISRLGVKTNKKSLWMAGGNFLPTISLQYLKTWNKYDFEDDLNDNSGQLSLNFSLPIFPLVDNGLEVAASRHNWKQSVYELQAAENTMELALKSSVLNLVATAKTVHASDISLEYARQTYEQMKERFSNGQITANELLSTEIMYFSAQNQSASIFYDYLSAKASLLQLLGTDDEQVLNKIIENI